MDSKLFDFTLDRTNTSSVKWDLRKDLYNKEDVLPMWVADMDFATPNFIIDAIKQRLSHPVLGYSFRSESYFQSIINWQKKQHNWEIKKEWICFSPGVVPALNMLVLALTNENDKIIIQPPVYPPFFDAVKNNNRKLLLNQLNYEDGKYSINFKDLKEKIALGAKMLILSNPHNPCGRVWKKEELISIIELCKENDVLILSDEIHCDLVLSNFKHQALAFVGKEYSDHIITAIAPSKTFNIAGMASSSVIISNEELRKKYENTLETIHVGMGNVLGAVASEAAYTLGELWLEHLINYLSSNISYTNERLAPYQKLVKVIPTEATYLLWLDFNGMRLTDAELSDFLIQKANLGLNKGTDFGSGGSGFARMNIACSKETLVHALNQLEVALKEFN
ncbi:MAG: PatB family C-S lyase [Bacteroidota bacterium]